MKKRLLAASLVVALCMGTNTVAFAHGHHHNNTSKTYVCGYCSEDCSYVDADHDGYCDNCDRKICQKTSKNHRHTGHAKICRHH